MANYEKQVEQEAAYPIPISLYNCYRTVRHEKRYISGIHCSYASLLMPHCPVTVVQRYRDGVCSLLFHSFFIICHPYIPLHLEFILLLYCFLVVPMHHLQYRCKKEICIIHAKLSFPSSLFAITVDTFHAGIELGPHRYDATLLTSTLCCTRLVINRA